MASQQDEDEFLTVKELSARIKFSRQNIYNRICKKEFILNKHYLKPSPKKILFRWKAVKEWLEDRSGNVIPEPEAPRKDAAEIKTRRRGADQTKSLINI